MTDDPQPTPKPKRKRRTKAQIEADRQAQIAAEDAEADKPIDPLVWVLLGAGLLFIAVITWLDAETLANAGYNPSIFQLIPLLMIRLFGKTPAVVILFVLSGIPLVYGVVGWIRKRMG